MQYDFLTTKEQKPEIQGMTVFNTEEVNTKKQPMFFGKPLGVQRYDSYKYPVFDKLTTQQLGYFWRPEEVSLQKDRGDYQTLRPEQKHIRDNAETILKPAYTGLLTRRSVTI